MTRPSNLKVGDKFVVGFSDKGNPHHTFSIGEVVTLVDDDETDCCFFSNGKESCYVSFGRLTPHEQPLHVEQLHALSEWHINTSGLTTKQFAALWGALVESGFDTTRNQDELKNRGFVKYCSGLNYIWSGGLVSMGKEVAHEELLMSPSAPVSIASITMEDCYKLVAADHALVTAQMELDNAKGIVENRLQELNTLKTKYNIK